jgi:hypothetical protein
MSALRHSAFLNQCAAKIGRLIKKKAKSVGKKKLFSRFFNSSANTSVSVLRCLYVEIIFIFSEFVPRCSFSDQTFSYQYIKPVNIFISY